MKKRNRESAGDAENELQQRYEDLINRLHVGIFRHTVDGHFIEVNQAGISIAEADSKEEFMKHTVSDFFQEKGHYQEIVNRVLETGFMRDIEIELQTLKGRRFWASISVVVKKDRKGNIYLDGIVEDITEKKRLEDQLRQAQKMEAVGQLAGGVAHDFNNILTAIVGYAQILNMMEREDDLKREYLEHILTSCEKAARLTQGLLAFSRKQVMNLTVTNLNHVVKMVETFLKRVIGEDIEFETGLSEKVLMVKIDPLQIEQVLMNLATNARDAMPDGGVLKINTDLVKLDDHFIRAHGYGSPGSYAILSISDTGEGMDEETRKRIFEPFFTTKGVGKGTGLGLSIVYGIIKQHHGFINVYSEPDRGTIFKIYLPLATEMTREKGPIEAFPPTGGTETILLAEDNAEVRKVTGTVLAQFGYRVIQAVDGEDAVNKFMGNKEAVQLLLLDIVMPKKSGKDTYDEIRRIRPGIKVLFTSGYMMDMAKNKEILEEGLDYISKPVLPTELLKKVREILDRIDH